MDPSIVGVCPRPRNPRACERCRSSKIRCLQSDQAGTCQKCLTSRKECIFGVRAKRRPKGERQSSKENSSHNEVSQTVNQPYPSPFDAQPTPSSDNSDDYDDDETASFYKIHKVAFQNMIGDDSEKPEESVSNNPKPNDLNDITKDFMDLNEANRIIHNFQDMKSFFPFVVIPDNATAKSMAQNSPFLLLAILVVASSHASDLHRKLDAEFCKLLGLKIVTNGEKNLDLLQGLLVYIAWYPFHLKLHKQCMYMYLQIAFSMCVQLKLDKPSKPLPEVFPPNEKLSKVRQSRRKASQRAYLGCHYLSSGITAGYKKPPIMSETDYMRLCGASLAEEPEVGSDRLLRIMVELGYIQYESDNMLKNCSSRPDAAYIQVKIETLQKRLQNCTSSIPHDYQDSTILKLMQRYTNFSIYCSALEPPQNPSAPLANEIRLKAFGLCLDSTKQFLDHALEVPTSEYWKFSVLAWGYIIHSLIISLQLSSTFLFPQWDSTRAREALQLGTRLDCLCWRIQKLDIRSGESSKARTNFSLFQTAFSTFKETYDKAMQLDVERTSNMSNMQLSEPMDLDAFRDELGMASCPALRRSPVQIEGYGGTESSYSSDLRNNVPLYHDIWATMTMSWAA